MHGYTRPRLTDLVLHDADGQVIPYGSRWTDGDGPEESYSVTTHPERFAPLVTVAEAIVEHLTRTYAVEVTETSTTHHREVTLTPTDTRAAPLTIVVSDFPSASFRTGTSVSINQMCGCDHCDEDVVDLAGELEEGVAAVVAGQLSECATGWELRHADGQEWQVSGLEVTRDGDGGWRTEFVGPVTSWGPWPLR